jgi:hypothetical protein
VGRCESLTARRPPRFSAARSTHANRPTRLVGQDEPGRGLPIHQARQNRRAGGVAANDAMLTETKYVAETRDRDGAGLGRKRALFGLFYFIAKDDLINLF